MHNIEASTKLLQNELAASETYQQALEHFRKDVQISEADDLMPIYTAHQHAVTQLQAYIVELAGTPVAHSGAWGAWAKIVVGGANLLGKDAILHTLQEGESTGEQNYQEALADSECAANLRTLITSQLLPAQQAHIRTLERLLATAA